MRQDANGEAHQVCHMPIEADLRPRQDNDIFQLARNINVGFFASVVLRDYVAAILNTPRANSEWSLDLGKEIKQGGTRVERYVQA
jgi:hypothetical protein